jgi:dCMP deaminase
VSDKWDRRFIELARHVSGWSKDPSTKVGAVVIAPDRTIVSLGFNGFARGVGDLPERYEDRLTKYRMVVHAETNAILVADRVRLRDSTLYVWPFIPCAACAGTIIQSGVAEVVAPPAPLELADRWADDMVLTRVMFEEARLVLREVTL